MNIDALVKDWAWRVNDGIPDPNKKSHIDFLKETLKQYKYSDKFINEFLANVSDSNKPIRDFQKLCVEVGKILSEDSLITEASIYKEKYPVGHQVTLNQKGKDWWGKNFGKAPDVLSKAAEQDVPEERIAQKGSGNTVLYVADGKKVYKIVGTASGIGVMFVHLGNPSGIKWNERTLESAALAGLSFNPQPFIDALKGGDENAAGKAKKSAIKALSSALSNGEMRGGSEISSKLATCSLPDLILALELANGTHLFAKAKGCLGWNFIHSQIDSYYTAHDSNPKLKIGGSKVPTPDCIIVKGNPSSLIKNIATDGVKFDSNGKCTTDSGDVFFQVSNKKSDSGAQLGRITSLVTATYGLSKPSDAIKMVIGEEIGKYENHTFLLNEGLKDYFKKGLTYLKDKFTKTMSVIKGKLQGLGSAITSTIMKFSGNTKPVDNLIKKLGRGFDKTLTEAAKPRLSPWTFAQACVNEYHQGDSKRLKSFFSNVTREYNLVSKKFGKNGIYATVKTSGPSLSTLPEGRVGANVVLKYMVNYLAYNTLNTMLTDQSGNILTASQFMEDFIELEKEMYFGSSELPIYKVFMSDGSGTPFQYLSSGKEFREERKSIIEEFGSKQVPGVVIESNPNKNYGYTNNNLYVLNSFSEEGPVYTQVALRSSGDDKLTFSVSGTGKTKWRTLGPKVRT